MRIELIENMQPDKWDEVISGFDSKCLFHESAWLTFLEETQRGQIVRFSITDNEEIRGYFVGLIIKKGPLKILGSPLKGWTTNYMGPIVNEGFDMEKFLLALDDLCRECRIDHVELCNPIFDTVTMERHGYEFSEGLTYVVTLTSEEEVMWKKLDRVKCRQAINRARRNGLIVSENYSPEFVDMFYEQLKEVFAKQKLVPTYSIDRVRSLFQELSSDRIIAVEVRHNDEVIATGIFPHDDRGVIGFGAASWRRAQKMNPNELLWWTAMTIAAGKGLRTFDMGGRGSFKPKFGGKEVPVYWFFKSYSLIARVGRKAYKLAFRARQEALGRYHNFLLRK